MKLDQAIQLFNRKNERNGEQHNCGKGLSSNEFVRIWKLLKLSQSFRQAFLRPTASKLKYFQPNLAVECEVKMDHTVTVENKISNSLLNSLLLQNKMAAKIQKRYHHYKSRKLLRNTILSVYEKQFHLESQQFVYINALTGEWSWKKPILLGTNDIPDPPNVWYEKQDSNTGALYYFNPSTGQSSWVNASQAAIRIQNFFRNYRQELCGRMPLCYLVKALKFRQVSMGVCRDNIDNDEYN